MSAADVARQTHVILRDKQGLRLVSSNETPELVSATYRDDARKTNYSAHFLRFGNVVVFHLVQPDGSVRTVPLTDGREASALFHDMASSAKAGGGGGGEGTSGAAARDTEGGSTNPQRPSSDVPLGSRQQLHHQQQQPPAPPRVGAGDLDPFNMGRSGGMFAGPELFRPHGSGSAGVGAPARPGFLPPGSVPPGARFDPIVPGGDPRFDPSQTFQRSGQPDNDEFKPPGFEDMFS